MNELSRGKTKNDTINTARYENRSTDFYCRCDRGGRSKLHCSPHLHYHIEFVCMLGGSVDAYADAEGYKVKAGDIFIAFPNQVHRFISTENEKYRLFIISPDLIPEFLPVFTSGVPRSALIPGAAADTEIDNITAALAAYEDVGGNAAEKQTDGRYRDAVIRGYLLALFGRLLPMMSFSLPGSGDSRALSNVVNFCSRRYAEDLSLDMLENELHLSKYYISHLFSGKLGIRFNDYVNSLRVSHACRLLSSDDAAVTEVAAAVGFNTLRTFNRAFYRFRGMTPSEYRRRPVSDLRPDPPSIIPDSADNRKNNENGVKHSEN